MNKLFNPTLGALLPEDVVYHIIEISGRGNWRNGKFIYRFREDDKRLNIIKQITPIQRMKFYVDIDDGGFNTATYDYYIELYIPGTSKHYHLGTAEFSGGNQNLIKYTIDLIADNEVKNVHTEYIYYNKN